MTTIKLPTPEQIITSFPNIPGSIEDKSTNNNHLYPQAINQHQCSICAFQTWRHITRSLMANGNANNLHNYELTPRHRHSQPRWNENHPIRSNCQAGYTAGKGAHRIGKVFPTVPQFPEVNLQDNHWLVPHGLHHRSWRWLTLKSQS